MNKVIFIKEYTVTKIKTPYITLRESEGIIHCAYSRELNITIEIAKHCVNERIKFSNGKSYPCLIDVRNIKSITKESREFFALEGIELVTAGALITESIFSKMLGNIFLTINKPKVPTKLFSNKTEALIWLKKYL